MRWEPTLATGVPELDEQHREILAELRVLIHSIRRGRSRAQVGSTLAVLRAHVAEHFAAEEALMSRVAFPDLERHRAEHDGFATDLEDLDRDHERHGATPALVLRVSEYVTSLLRKHLFESDHALATFLRKRG
jgi:hemerythrin